MALGEAGPIAAQALMTMGHVNLHYPRPEDGPAAARMLQLMGLGLTQDLVLPNGTHFYRFTCNRHDVNRGDGIIYLSVVPEGIRALSDAVWETLKVGQPGEHPAVGKMHAGAASDPEQHFHVGFLVDSLEAVEDMMVELKRLSEEDPQLKGRMKFLVNRAQPGNPAVDARLDQSPIYKGVTRYTYGKNGVQAFVQTDLIVSGPLLEGIVLEFDYIWPGCDNHILSVAEI